MGSVTKPNDPPIGREFVANFYPSGLAGYVYEADVHCVDCSKERFGQDLQGRVAGWHSLSGTRDPNPPLDSEGNPVSAITGEMEFHCSLFCGDCRKDLSEEVVILHRIPTGKRTCTYCGVNVKAVKNGFIIRDI